MFYIIKRTSGWWHKIDNTKEASFSEWEIILESVGQTVVLELPNGANYPQKAVGILDVIVIDETDASLEETFSNVNDLKLRLEVLMYPPYSQNATYRSFNLNMTYLGVDVDAPVGFEGIVSNLTDIYSDVTFGIVADKIKFSGGVTTGDRILINGDYPI